MKKLLLIALLHHKTCGSIVRIFLSLCIVLGLATSANAQWAEVQTNGSSPVGSATSIAHTITTNITAGSLIVCAGAHQVAGITGVSGSLNGAYTQLATGSPVTGGRTISGWYFANSAAGSETVTFSLDASVSGRVILCTEYSGLATSPFDVSNGRAQTNPGTGTDAVTSNAVAAIAQASSLIWSASASQQDGVVYTAGTGYTLRATRAGASSTQLSIEDATSGAAGTTPTATWTIDSTSDDTGTLIAVFKLPAASGESGRIMLMGVGK